MFLVTCLGLQVWICERFFQVTPQGCTYFALKLLMCCSILWVGAFNGQAGSVGKLDTAMESSAKL